MSLKLIPVQKVGYMHKVWHDKEPLFLACFYLWSLMIKSTASYLGSLTTKLVASSHVWFLKDDKGDLKLIA